VGGGGASGRKEARRKEKPEAFEQNVFSKKIAMQSAHRTNNRDIEDGRRLVQHPLSMCYQLALL
jgi:hypothetical protein